MPPARYTEELITAETGGSRPERLITDLDMRAGRAAGDRSHLIARAQHWRVGVSFAPCVFPASVLV